MRAIVIAVSVAAGVAFAVPAMAQSAGGGGAAGGASGAGGTGSSGASSTPPPIQTPAPFTGQTNPGVTPSAPGPSQAHVPRGTSPKAPQTGYASSGRRPGAADVPQDDTSSTEAMKELDKELDRKLSICRGC